jgi:hypothetical protein
MFDTITNFHVALDRIDLSEIGSAPLRFQVSQFTGGTLSAAGKRCEHLRLREYLQRRRNVGTRKYGD